MVSSGAARQEAYRKRGLALAASLGEEFRERLGDQFVSSILMGSLARGDHVPSFSGLNLFLVVRENRPVYRKRVREAIESQSKDFPDFYPDAGGLVVVIITTRNSLTGPQRPSAGRVNSLNRYELRTSGLTITGEDLIPKIPEGEIEKSEVKAVLRSYAKRVADYNPAAYFGRMALVQATLNIARMDAILHGQYVVLRSDVVKVFGRIHPKGLSVASEALDLRANWGDELISPTIFRRFQGRVRPWAKFLSEEPIPH